jgi:predicted anti-sigma-YlaC factor YlaD
VVDHTAASELLGVYALDACDEPENAGIRAHLGACAACATEAGRLAELSGWLGASDAVSPPEELRSRVLRQSQDDGQA